MFIRSFLYRHAPTPGSLMDAFDSKSGWSIARPFLQAYLAWWNYSRSVLSEWHREALKEVDDNFTLQNAERELIKAREAARARGVRPLDPEYPDIFDFIQGSKLHRK